MASAGTADPFWARTIPLPKKEDLRVFLDLADSTRLDRLLAKRIDFWQAQSLLVAAFDVRPALRFYDDGDRPNAHASPLARFPAEGRDGVVLLGIRLVGGELSDIRIARTMGGVHPGDEAVLLLMAHEWAHILQFKNGMSVEGPWQMEPHADFMAGWFLSRSARGQFVPHDVENGAQTMFKLGDTKFNDPAHHGEPQFRAVMVRAGYEAGEQGLEVMAAFDKGRQWAGLPARQ